ncbi:hypothetical protein [Streptomyces paradoxus]|uniref:hypothetical protein n=1 Tax=Streptomyces paradoxus TaxID=66375 RepID=UPI00380D6E47
MASTSPRTSVMMTTASATGVPPSAERTTPARPLVPLSSTSYATGSPATTIVDACGW